jgi:hypothetical protein
MELRLAKSKGPGVREVAIPQKAPDAKEADFSKY